jgi:hypothetical protein
MRGSWGHRCRKPLVLMNQAWHKLQLAISVYPCNWHTLGPDTTRCRGVTVAPRHPQPGAALGVQHAVTPLGLNTRRRAMGLADQPCHGPHHRYCPRASSSWLALAQPAITPLGPAAGCRGLTAQLHGASTSPSCMGAWLPAVQACSYIHNT